jgi:RNA polymerase sigma-70 factor, ECF subfamily
MTTEYSEDDQMMIRLQEGDTHAFNDVVAAWQRRLLAFFVRNTRDEQLSEDLVQETLLRLHKAAWDYLPTGCFKGWIFRIARNLLIDHSRRASHDVLLKRVSPRKTAGGDEFDPLKLVADDLVSPMLSAETQEIAAIVDEMLQQLPDEQRQTFQLHHYESLTLPEVADAMETSLPTAKSRLRLAKEKLRYLLSCRGLAEAPISELN